MKKLNKQSLFNLLLSKFYVVAKADENKGEVKEEPKEQTNNDPNPKTDEQGTDEKEAGEKEVETKEEPKEEKKASKKGDDKDPYANVRKEEKDKLYKEIQGLKDDRKRLLGINSDKEKEITKLTKENQELLNEISQLEQELQDKESESPKANEDYQGLNLEVVTLRDEISKMQTEHEKELQKVKMDNFRLKELSKPENANIIPELVRGDTEEELLESIKVSKERYESIAKEVAKSKSSSLPKATDGQSVGVISTKGAPDVRTMSHEEFAEYRKQLGLI